MGMKERNDGGDDANHGQHGPAAKWGCSRGTTARSSLPLSAGEKARL